MKRLVIVGLALAASLAVVAPAGAQTFVGCAKHPGAVAKPKVKPRSCNMWYSWMSHAEAPGDFTKLHWRHWGSRSATATAITTYRGMGIVDRQRVRVRFSRPVGFENGSGGVNLPAFTRVQVTYRDGRTGGSTDLPYKFDLWPDY